MFFKTRQADFLALSLARIQKFDIVSAGEAPLLLVTVMLPAQSFSLDSSPLPEGGHDDYLVLVKILFSPLRYEVPVSSPVAPPALVSPNFAQICFLCSLVFIVSIV